MDFIIDAIVEWLKGLLVDGIMGNLDGLFDNVNQSVGEIATQVGTTPADWNAGVFSMIRQISETAILPIAGADGKSSCPLWPGLHTYYNGVYKERQACEGKRIS